MARKKPTPVPCPDCGNATDRPHCPSPRCTWLHCRTCQIVFSPAGVTAGRSFPRPD